MASKESLPSTFRLKNVETRDFKEPLFVDVCIAQRGYKCLHVKNFTREPG